MSDIHIQITSSFDESGISKAITELKALTQQITNGSGQNTNASTQQVKQLTQAVTSLAKAQQNANQQTKAAKSSAQQQAQQIDQLISKTTRLQRLTNEANRATDQRMDAEKKLADITQQSLQARQRLADIQKELDQVEAKGNTNITEKTQLLKRLSDEQKNLSSLEKQRAAAEKDVDASAESYRRLTAAAKDYGSFLTQNNVQTKESARVLAAAQDNIRTIQSLNQRANPLSTFTQQGDLNRTAASLTAFTNDLNKTNTQATRVFDAIGKGTTSFARNIENSVATIRRSFSGVNASSTSGLQRMEDQLGKLGQQRMQDAAKLLEANNRLEEAQRQIEVMNQRVARGENIPASAFRSVQTSINSAARDAERATAALEKTDSQISALETKVNDARTKMQQLMTEAQQAATQLTGQTKPEMAAQEMFTKLNASYTKGIDGLNQVEAKLKAESTQIKDVLANFGGKGLGAGPSEALNQVKAAMQANQGATAMLANLWNSLRSVAAGLATTISGMLVGALDRMGSAINRSLHSAGSYFANLRKDLDATGRSMNTFDKGMERTAAGWSLLMAGGQMTQTGMSIFRRMNEAMGGYLGLEQASTRAAIAGSAQGNNVSTQDIMDMVFKIERGQYGQAPVKNLSSEQIASGIYYYSSAIGAPITKDNQANIANSMTPMLQLAAYSGANPEEIIKGVLNAAMEFGIDPNNAKAVSQIANLQGYLANATVMEQSDIQEFFKMVGANANVLSPNGGLGALQDAMGLAYIDSMYGQKGGRTGRGVDQLLSSLLSPAGPMQKTAKEIWGVNDVRDMFFKNQKGPDGKDQYVLKNGLASLFEPFTSANMTDEQWKKAQATMFTQNGSRVLIPLITEMRKNPEKWNQVKGELDSPEALNTIMAAGAKASDTLTASLQDLKNAWGQVVATTTGSVKGGLMSGIGAFANGLREISDIIKAVPQVGQIFAGLTTGLAGLLALGGSLLTFSGALLILERAAQMTGAGMGTFLGLLTALPKIALLSVPVLGLMAAGAIALYEAWKHNIGGVQDKWNGLKKAFSGDISGKLFDALGSTTAQHAFENVAHGGLAFKELVAGIGMGIGPVNDLGRVLQNVFGVKLGADILQHMTTAGVKMRSFVGTIGKGAGEIRQALPSFGLLKASFQGIAEVLAYGTTSKPFANAVNMLGMYFGVENLTQKLQIARLAVIQFVENLKSDFSKIGDNLGKIFTLDNLKAALDFAIGFIKGFVAGAAGAFTGIVKGVELFTSALTHLGAVGKTIADLTQKLFGFRLSMEQVGEAVGLAFGAKWMSSIMSFNPVVNALKLVISYGGQAAMILLNLGAQAAIAGAQFVIMGATMAISWLLGLSPILSIGAAVIAIFAGIGVVIAGLIGIVSGFGSAMSFLSGMWSGFTTVIGAALAALQMLGSVIMTVLSVAVSVLSTFFSMLNQLSFGLISASNAGFVFGAALGALVVGLGVAAAIEGVSAAVSGLQAAWSVATMGVSMLVAAFNSLSIAAIRSAIVSTISSAWSGMIAVFAAVGTATIALVAAMDGLTLASIRGAVASALSAAWSGLVGIFQTAVGAVVALRDAFLGLAASEAAADVANPAALIGVAVVAGVAIAIAGLTLLIEKTGSVKNAFMLLAEEIAHYMAEAFDQVMNTFANFWNKMVDSADKAMSELSQAPGYQFLKGASLQSAKIDPVNWSDSIDTGMAAMFGKTRDEILAEGEKTHLTFQQAMSKAFSSIGLPDISFSGNPMDLMMKLVGLDPKKFSPDQIANTYGQGLNAMGYTDVSAPYQRQMDMLRSAQGARLAAQTNPYKTEDRRGSVISQYAPNGEHAKWLSTELLDTSGMPLKGPPDVGNFLQGTSDAADSTASSTDDAAQKIKDAQDKFQQFLSTLQQLSGLGDFTHLLNLTGLGGDAIKAADGLNQTTAAMNDGYRVAVTNTEALANAAKQTKDWADNLIGDPGYYAVVDDLLNKNLITLDQYNAAQQAQIQISENAQGIQLDMQAIQAQQAPVLADLMDKQHAYVDQIREMSGVQQMAALAAMDQNETMKAQQALMLASSAAAGELGDNGKKMATELIQGAVAADPYLAALLQQMGLISVGADGKITVNFDGATKANDAMTELTKSIDALTEALGGIPPLHVDSSGAVQATRDVEAYRAAIRGLNDDLVQNGTRGVGGQSRPYGPSIGGEGPNVPAYKDPVDAPKPVAGTAGASVPTQVTVKADTTQVDQAQQKVDTLAKTNATVTVKAETSSAQTQIDSVNTSVKTLSSQTATVKVTAETSGFMVPWQSAINALGVLKGMTTTVKVTMDDSGFLKPAQDIGGVLATLGQMNKTYSFSVALSDSNFLSVAQDVGGVLSTLGQMAKTYAFTVTLDTGSFLGAATDVGGVLNTLGQMAKSYAFAVTLSDSNFSSVASSVGGVLNTLGQMTKSYAFTVTMDDSGFETAAASVGGVLNTLGQMAKTYAFTVTLVADAFFGTNLAVFTALNNLDARTATAKVTLDDGAFETTAGTVGSVLNTLAQTTVTPKVFLDISVFEGGASNVENRLSSIGNTVATPSVNLNDNASGSINNIIGLMNSVNGMVSTVTIQTNTVNTVTTISNPVKASALGGRVTTPLTWLDEWASESVSLPGTGMLMALPKGSTVHSSTETRGLLHEANTHTAINSSSNRSRIFNEQSSAQGDITITFGDVYVQKPQDIDEIANAVARKVDEIQGRMNRSARRGMTSLDAGRYDI